MGLISATKPRPVVGGHANSQVIFKHFYVLLMLVISIGCAPRSHTDAKSITLATTTSTHDSGLLDALLPLFTKQTGIEVKVVAVGTGQALAMGRRGDADVLLTHAPPAEQEFMDAGHGSQRRPVMHNDFVIVGPVPDPAKIASERRVADALKKISAQQSPFVSRGDDSGTHIKERAIWQTADIEPAGNWYIEAGVGMAHALRLANERQAYTLSDRSTFLAHRDQLDLAILCEHDPPLNNLYSVILVNPARHPGIAHTAALEFADFLASSAARDVIRTFGQQKYGQPLFFLHTLAPQ